MTTTSARQEALDLVQTTLDNMAYGGIYDHVGVASPVFNGCRLAGASF